MNNKTSLFENGRNGAKICNYADGLFASVENLKTTFHKLLVKLQENHPAINFAQLKAHQSEQQLQKPERTDNIFENSGDLTGSIVQITNSYKVLSESAELLQKLHPNYNLTPILDRIEIIKGDIEAVSRLILRKYTNSLNNEKNNQVPSSFHCNLNYKINIDDSILALTDNLITIWHFIKCKTY